MLLDFGIELAFGAIDPVVALSKVEEYLVFADGGLAEFAEIEQILNLF
jgi:hypothetical protein